MVHWPLYHCSEQLDDLDAPPPPDGPRSPELQIRLLSLFSERVGGGKAFVRLILMPDNFGATALHRAARHCEPSVVKWLLGEPSLQLLMTVDCPSPSLPRKLLVAPTRSGFLPYHEAAMGGREASVESCILAMRRSFPQDAPHLLAAALYLLDVKWMQEGNILISKTCQRLQLVPQGGLPLRPKGEFQLTAHLKHLALMA